MVDIARRGGVERPKRLAVRGGQDRRGRVEGTGRRPRGSPGCARQRGPLTMPSYLDLGLIAIILVSALLSMVRGFTREILAIGSWAAAAAAAYFFYPLVVPYVAPYIHKEPVAAGDRRRAGVLCDADRGLGAHGAHFRRHPRQQGRRAGSLAGLFVRRGARLLARRRRLRDFQLAGRRQASNPNGSRTPRRGRSCSRPPSGSCNGCPTTPSARSKAG